LGRETDRRGKFSRSETRSALITALRPPARRTCDPRYHTWPLAARFLAAAGETHWQDGPGQVAVCRLALAIAERLPEAAYPPGFTYDLVAHALGGLARLAVAQGRATSSSATPPSRRSLPRIGGGL